MESLSVVGVVTIFWVFVESLPANFFFQSGRLLVPLQYLRHTFFVVETYKLEKLF